MTARVLVTGASGFLGRHVLADLAVRGFEAMALGRSLPIGLALKQFFPIADVGDASTIRQAVTQARPDVILHLAGSPDAGGIEELYRINVLFGWHLLAAARTIEPYPTVLFAGSAAEYGPVAAAALPVSEDFPCRPNTPYGITKLAQTFHGLTASQAGMPVVIARLFNPIGAGMPKHLALGSFAEQIIRMGPPGGCLLTGDLDVERDFIAASDAAGVLVELAFSTRAHGQVVNVCSGQPTQLRRLTERLIAVSGAPVQLRTDTTRRGVSDMPSHFGSPNRLVELGIVPPSLDVDRVVTEILSAC